MVARIVPAGRAARALVASGLIALLLAACSTLQIGVESATPTKPATIARPTAAPTSAPATAAPATAAPTPAPSPSPTPKPPVLVDRVKVFLVAIGDGGKAGKAIGCGDSIVAVERQIQPTSEPLKAAYQELLSIHDREYGQSGLYNALYQCNLKVDSVTLVSGKATVRLSGQTALAGECDNPRVGAQLTEVALQFPTVKEVTVFVNGKTLEQWLSLK